MKLNEIFQASRVKNLRPNEFTSSDSFENVNYYKILKYFTYRYGKPVGAGRHRVGFKKGNVIVKVPKNDMGMIDNEKEYRLYRQGQKKPKKYLPMAKNKILYIQGVPILYIEKLDISDRLEKYPRWAEQIDSLQVGKDKKGKWKAFDYAG